MDDRSNGDLGIPPLLPSSDPNTNSGKKRMREHTLLKECRRRAQMTQNFMLLKSLVPSIPKNIKVTKEMIASETAGYIKYLEEEAARLEGLKKLKSLDQKCWNVNCSVKVGVAIAKNANFFAVQRPSRKGIVTQILKVFENHRAEVLEARISVDDQKRLTFTSTLRERRSNLFC